MATNNIEGSTLITKTWGTEEVIVNTPDYCMKILNVDPVGVCSLHRHLIKDETFLVVSGVVMLEIRDPDGDSATKTLQTKYLGPMRSIRIRPGVWHRFRSARRGAPVVMVECSTHHSDDDVERLIASYREVV